MEIKVGDEYERDYAYYRRDIDIYRSDDPKAATARLLREIAEDNYTAEEAIPDDEEAEIISYTALPSRYALRPGRRRAYHKF